MRKPMKVGLAILFWCAFLAIVPGLLWEGLRVCLGATVPVMHAAFPGEIHALERHAETLSEVGPLSEAALVFRDAEKIFDDSRIERVSFSVPSDPNSNYLLIETRADRSGWSLHHSSRPLEQGDERVTLWRGDGRWLAEYRFSPGPPAPPGFLYEMWVALDAPEAPAEERPRAIVVPSTPEGS